MPVLISVVSMCSEQHLNSIAYTNGKNFILTLDQARSETLCLATASPSNVNYSARSISCYIGSFIALA